MGCRRRTLTDHGHDMIHRELAIVFLRELGKVDGGSFERGRSRAVTFTGNAVAWRAIITEHLLPGGRITLLYGGLFNRFLLAPTHSRRQQGSSKNRKQQESDPSSVGDKRRVFLMHDAPPCANRGCRGRHTYSVMDVTPARDNSHKRPARGKQEMAASENSLVMWESIPRRQEPKRGKRRGAFRGIGAEAETRKNGLAAGDATQNNGLK